MDYAGLLIFIATGAAAGWLAGILMQERSFGLLGNIIIGITGAIAGGLLFALLGLAGSILTACSRGRSITIPGLVYHEIQESILS